MSDLPREIDVAGAAALLSALAEARRQPRSLSDATSFLMDRDLVVANAEGQSILRLPWFDEELFVGRQLPDISEMPKLVRQLCVANYSAALEGERGEFAFTSYGHAYTVDAVPVRGDEGRIDFALAVARPARSFAVPARGYERTAERLERSGAEADRRADLHRAAGRRVDEAAERRAAAVARGAAERARANARLLHARSGASALAAAPKLTERETEILQLASHGLTHNELADHLSLSTGTVRTHFENIYPKLGVSDKAAAVGAALRHGLID